MATIVIHGADRVQKMLSWYEGKELFNRMRRAVRAGGKQMQQGLKDAAAVEPTGNLPDTFRKVPAPKISASTRRGGDIVAKVRPKSPLFNIFEPGAGRHSIAPKHGELAGGADEHFRDAAFFSAGPVSHPGFEARPIMPSAFASRQLQAEAAIANILFEPSR